MNRQQARERREQIAATMRQSQDVAQVAAKFSVSERLVRRSCLEFRVEILSRQIEEEPEVSPKVLADLRNGRKPVDVAKGHGLTKKRLDLLQEQLANPGLVRNPKRKKSRV